MEEKIKEQKNNIEEKNDTPLKANGTFAIAAISIFMSILVLPMLVWGVLAVIPGGHEAFEVELNENRNLAEISDDVTLANLTAQLEAYINDRLPFRSALVSLQQSLTNKLEEPYKETIRPALIDWLYSDIQNDGINPPFGDILDNDIITGNKDENPKVEVENEGNANCTHENMTETILIEATCLQSGSSQLKCNDCGYSEKHTLPNGHVGNVIKIVEASYEDYGYTLNKCTRCQGEYRTNVSNKKYDNSILPLTISKNPTTKWGAVEGKYQWLFYEECLKHYQNNNQRSYAELQKHTQKLQDLHEVCEANGKQLVVLILPNKEEVYPEYMPYLSVTTGQKRVATWVNYIKRNSDVNIVYPHEELVAAKPYWQVYSRLDTHWNAAGGFIGVQALYKALGMETTPMYNLPIIESTEKSLSNNDLVGIGGFKLSDFKPDTDYIISYKEDIKVKVSGGLETHDVTVTTSDSPNKCNLVMLGDSFRKNMVPFLYKDFSNCLFTHRNNITAQNITEDLRQAIRDADIIVLQTVERADTAILSTADIIMSILK